MQEFRPKDLASPHQSTPLLLYLRQRRKNLLKQLPKFGLKKRLGRLLQNALNRQKWSCFSQFKLPYHETTSLASRKTSRVSNPSGNKSNMGCTNTTAENWQLLQMPKR